MDGIGGSLVTINPARGGFGRTARVPHDARDETGGRAHASAARSAQAGVRSVPPDARLRTLPEHVRPPATAGETGSVEHEWYAVRRRLICTAITGGLFLATILVLALRLHDRPEAARTPAQSEHGPFPPAAAPAPVPHALAPYALKGRRIFGFV